jgi:hypothetical protein
MDTSISILGWLTLGLLIAAFIISIIRKGNKGLFPIQIYLIISIVSYLLDFALKQKKESLIVNISTLLEIFLFYYFLYFNIKKLILRKLIKLFFVIYFVICLTYWIARKDSIFLFDPTLYGFESLLITIPCLFYIYELLKSNLLISLKSDASFISTCGLLFYFSISIPTYFSWYTLYYLSPGFDKILSILIISSYMILIVSFMKAYLCPIQDQQR